jgi:hypothetical protein
MLLLTLVLQMSELKGSLNLKDKHTGICRKAFCTDDSGLAQ